MARRAAARKAPAPMPAAAPPPWTLEAGARSLLAELARQVRSTHRDLDYERTRLAQRFAEFGADLARGWIPLGSAPTTGELERHVALARSANETLFSAALELDPAGLQVAMAIQAAFAALRRAAK